MARVKIIDLPKSAAGDSELKVAMRKLPAIQQARLNAPDGTVYRSLIVHCLELATST